MRVALVPLSFLSCGGGSGYRPLGVKKSERTLPVGSLITVVGELALSSDNPGMLVLRKPQAGGPFYITKQTPAELHALVSTITNTCKVRARD